MPNQLLRCQILYAQSLPQRASPTLGEGRAPPCEDIQIHTWIEIPFLFIKTVKRGAVHNMARHPNAIGSLSWKPSRESSVLSQPKPLPASSRDQNHWCCFSKKKYVQALLLCACSCLISSAVPLQKGPNKIDQLPASKTCLNLLDRAARKSTKHTFTRITNFAPRFILSPCLF